MKTIRLILAILLAHVICACNANSSTPPAKRFKKDEYGLAIIGYNYTSRYIDAFTVNGHGGGNLRVSGPTSGGGGIVCCTSFYPDAPGLKIKVRWQADACRYVSFVTENGEKRWSYYSFFKEREVTPIVESDGEPSNMEIHIFPDDHVEAYVTSSMSMPRLKLSKERDLDLEYPRCPDDKKPE